MVASTLIYFVSLKALRTVRDTYKLPTMYISAIVIPLKPANQRRFYANDFKIFVSNDIIFNFEISSFKFLIIFNGFYCFNVKFLKTPLTTNPTFGKEFSHTESCFLLKIVSIFYSRRFQETIYFKSKFN